jgi:BolA protein
MLVKDEIARRLDDAFAPTHLDVADESHLHAGHASAPEAGQSHFRVTIRGEAFRDKTRLEMHRMVNEALAELIGNPIHALAINAAAD